MRVSENTPLFVLAYLALMIPTYVLPYFGSNSIVMAAALGEASGQGGGVLPTFWLHVLFLFSLGVLAWMRGPWVGKSWLPVFPAVAAFFDLMPGFSWIPLVPTGLHVAAVVVGAIRPVGFGLDPLEAPLRSDRKLWTLAVGGFVCVALFLVGAERFGARASQASAAAAERASRLGLLPEPGGAVSLGAAPGWGSTEPSAPLEEAEAPDGELGRRGSAAPTLGTVGVGEPTLRLREAGSVEGDPGLDGVPEALDLEGQDAVAEPSFPRGSTLPRDPVPALPQAIPAAAAKPLENSVARRPVPPSPADPIEDAKIEASRLMATDPCAAARRLEPHVEDARVRGMHRVVREACR